MVFFQFFFYEGRFGEDRDIYPIVVRGSERKNPKAKAGSHRRTDLKYMTLSKKKQKKTVTDWRKFVRWDWRVFQGWKERQTPLRRKRRAKRGQEVRITVSIELNVGKRWI